MKRKQNACYTRFIGVVLSLISTAFIKLRIIRVRVQFDCDLVIWNGKGRSKAAPTALSREYVGQNTRRRISMIDLVAASTGSGSASARCSCAMRQYRMVADAMDIIRSVEGEYIACIARSRYA